MNDNPQNLTNIQNPKTQEEQSRFDKFRSSPESAPASVTPPPPSQEPETSPPPEEPKKSNVKKSPFRFLPLIVMLAALSAAAYFGYENYILKMQQSSDPSPSPTVASSPTPSTSSEPTPRPELTNTYSNSDFLVTFRYPDGFTLQESTENLYIDPDEEAHSVNSVSMQYFGPTQREGTELYDGIALSFTQIPADYDLEEIVDARITFYESDNSSFELISAKSPTVVAGFKGYTFKVRGLGETTYIYLATATPVRNYHLVVSYSAPDPENLGHQSTIDQILSTIEYSEEAQKEIIKTMIEQETYNNLLDSVKDQDPTVTATVNKYDGEFAFGSVNISTGGGSVWLAKKVNGNWAKIWGGQEVPLCSEIEIYNVPKTITGCYAPEKE